MIDRDQIHLAQAVALCQSRDNYKVAFFCSRQQTVRDLLEYASLHFNVERIRWQIGTINFSNGSVIVITAPKQIVGWEMHKVFFDDADTIPYELKQQLRLRERLK